MLGVLFRYIVWLKSSLFILIYLIMHSLLDLSQSWLDLLFVSESRDSSVPLSLFSSSTSSFVSSPRRQFLL